MELVMVLLTLHVLGDFYFQSDKVAQKKQLSFKWVGIHAAQYAVPFALAFLFMRAGAAIILCMVLTVLVHFIIDSLKYILNKIKIFDRIKKFLFDQLLHILSIFIIVMYYGNIDGKIVLHELWNNILGIINIDFKLALRWILLIILILKPANIIFRLLFVNFKPDDASENAVDSKNKKAGAIIGCLERILIVLFVSIQQYSALGFILTAKSIARYDAIAKDRKFAEYYLIGTLVSVVYSIIAYAAVFMGL